MHLSHVGTNKFCFLLSVVFCGLLVLLIPSLQPPQRQGDLPQPRPHAKPTRAGHIHDLQRNPSSAGHHRNIDAREDSFTHPYAFRDRSKDLQKVLERDAAHANSPRSRSKDSLDLKDIFIAVKTTRKYHKSRLQLLAQTWVSKAKEQESGWFEGGLVLIPPKPPWRKFLCNLRSTGIRQRVLAFIQCIHLTAKGVREVGSSLPEASPRMLSGAQGNPKIDLTCVAVWFCHVDDDNYVILPGLLELLSSYSHTQDVYLGRPSLDHPIEAAERVKSDGSVSVKFWFATGGAGFCISRGLALKMSPWASLGNFITTAEKIRLPDDCTIGYIIEALLEVPLTHTGLFHSHLENLLRLPTNNILKQVTLSYGGYQNRQNVVSVGGAFSLAEDPSRFKTVHCLLYPDTDWCPRKTHH
ncbi:Beta-1,3-N-acetylglucosaminyltransferase radical fringe [Triplophysa tibetana]|uniref:Beta-1,3-N-acetylglucosaminyltransferase radical fringe n=1 Tax=Triplophysa tibetana TaxID=1572043 RepID=A0A5A9PYS3_9TELE|nr:Beta-1,3-N-acetylglucosaminyltransferase radical fringe [Triplophysa tibetana]